MDQAENAEGVQDVWDHEPETVALLRTKTLKTEFKSQTPVKTEQPLKIKLEGREFELLQRHKDMMEIFYGMSCSLRLLGLRKKPPIFQNIRAQVEVLTKRKFSYGHVAKLKYILPEAIQIDKTLVHDKETLCMKPDMKIMLVFDVVDGHNEQSNFIALHQLFTSELFKYFAANPEASDIPAAMLPDPFNQLKEVASETASGDRALNPEVIICEPQSQASQTIASENLLSNASLEDLPTTIERECLFKLSHMYPSFRRHFSEKVVTEREKTKLLAPPEPSSSLESYNFQNHDIKNANENLDTEYENVKESLAIISKSTSIQPQPTQPVSSQYSINTNTYESPLLKHVSTADSTAIDTPAQSTPKRIIPGSDDKHKGVTGQKQTSSGKHAKRSLDFSATEGDGAGYIDLPGLVSLIHHIFESINYSSITKEELVYKIIINNFDFVERGEVDEQIEKLEKLVPDWICKKNVPSGDALYSIKKMSDLNYLQSRVACM